MILRHIHLPGLTRYITASTLQDTLVAALLSHKKILSSSSSPSSTTTAPPPPPPTILTAQFHPAYTTGRRDLHTVSPSQQSLLTSPLLALPTHPTASFHPALRGGQTTFHGPGQLIAYPIIDLKRHNLSPRCYIHSLEAAVMSTCAHYGVETKRTENPGVWLNDEEKICAVGVHLRRNVTSHGIGLNVSTEMTWFERIVACGLEGKRTVSLEGVGVEPVPGVEEVADVFVRVFAEGLEGVEGVEREEGEVDE